MSKKAIKRKLAKLWDKKPHPPYSGPLLEANGNVFSIFFFHKTEPIKKNDVK